jgi:hypothetical protein
MSLLKDASKTKSVAISPKSEQKASALTSKNMSEACLMVCLEEEPDCQEPSVSSSAPDYQLELTAVSMGKIWAMYDYFHLRTSLWANDYTGMLDMLHQLWRRLFFELHSSHLHSLQSWTPVSKLSPQLPMRHIPAISRETFWLSANSWGLTSMDSQHFFLQQQRYDTWVVSFIAFNMLNTRRGGDFTLFGENL